MFYTMALPRNKHKGQVAFSSDPKYVRSTLAMNFQHSITKNNVHPNQQEILA
jgi:hypothetical protein